MKKYTMPSLQDILMIHEKEMFTYVMEAHRQKVEEKLLQNALFPHIPYVQTTLHDCNTFLSQIDAIYRDLPQNIVGVDMQNMRLLYEKVEYDNLVDIMYYKTVHFKKRLFKAAVELDKKYKEISSKLHWEPIGIVPPENVCGVLFARYEYESLVHTYTYSIPKIVPNQALLRVNLHYIDTWSYSFVNTYTSKKIEYIKKIPWYVGSPYCVLVSWKMPFPISRTIVPIIKIELPNIVKGRIFTQRIALGFLLF